MDTVSREITSQNGVDKIRIVGLRAGRLAIKKSAMNSKRPGLLSTLSTFRDKQFSAWFPVWAWVIVHPEGTFLIDTGLSSEVNQADYFNVIDPISKYYLTKQMKFEINREEELDYLLRKMGIETNEIDKVILTHLHIDHTGGLRHLSNIPILVNAKEWKTKDGAFTKLFPPNINIKTLSLNNHFETFENCQYVTKCKDLVMIHTPGHTRGHTSIALIGHKNEIYLFGGDVAYTKKRLFDKVFSSTIKNHADNIESCEKIIALSKQSKLVFLPTHDPDNKERLMNNNANV